MASFNKVILVGNLTRDPELGYTPGNVAIAKMGLAVSEKFKSKNSNEFQERVCFVDIDVWDRQAENCAKYLSKGSPVLIEGKLQLDQWESKQGEKRSKLKVRADRVQFLGSPKGTESDSRNDYSNNNNNPQNNVPQNDVPQNNVPQNDVPPADTMQDDDNLPF